MHQLLDRRVTRSSTSAGEAPGIAVSDVHIGTRICGSSSRGMIATAKIPMPAMQQ